MLSLNAFERHLDDKIVRRGRAYFDEGAVRHLEPTSTGYSAKVRGTDDYTVHVAVAGGQAGDWSCNCPYEHGDTCKHVVATLYAIAEFETSGRAATERAERVEIRARSRKTLTATSKKELIEGLLALADDDPHLYDLLALQFVAGDDEAESSIVIARLRKLVDATVTGRSFEYGTSRELRAAAAPFLNQLDLAVERGQVLAAFRLAVTLIEEATAQYELLDDSGGYLTDIVERSTRVLETLVAAPLPAPARTAMLKTLGDTVEQGRFIDWDWHLVAAQLACALVASRKEADALLGILGSSSNTYLAHRVELLELDLLRRFGSGEEAEDFAYTHLSNPDIRRAEVEGAFARSDYLLARHLALEGFEQHADSHWGLAHDWNDWLLKIALAQRPQDRVAVLKHAHFGFRSASARTELDYHQILRDQFDADAWPSYVDGLLSESRMRGTPSALTDQILVREQRWDSLLASLREYLSLDRLEQNGSLIPETYASGLIALYVDAVEAYLVDHVARKYYARACRGLARMIELGGAGEAYELAERLRRRYPQRRALREELGRVRLN